MRLTVNKRDTLKAFRHLDALLAAVSQQAFVAAKQAGDDYVNLVKTGIGASSKPSFISQEWEPLSESWKHQKVAYKEKFWAETLGIYKATQVDIINKTLLFINIFAGIKASTDYNAFRRARTTEYGYLPQNNPGRLLFEPAKDHLAPVTAAGRKLTPKQRKYLYRLCV